MIFSLILFLFFSCLKMSWWVSLRVIFSSELVIYLQMNIELGYRLLPSIFDLLIDDLISRISQVSYTWTISVFKAILICLTGIGSSIIWILLILVISCRIILMIISLKIINLIYWVNKIIQILFCLLICNQRSLFIHITYFLIILLLLTLFEIFSRFLFLLKLHYWLVL